MRDPLGCIGLGIARAEDAGVDDESWCVTRSPPASGPIAGPAPSWDECRKIGRRPADKSFIACAEIAQPYIPSAGPLGLAALTWCLMTSIADRLAGPSVPGAAAAPAQAAETP